MTKDKNVHQRLADVMTEVTYIRKDQKQGMKYTIVSHDKVTAKVRPALLKAGIVYYPVKCKHLHNGNRAECSLTVRFVNIDEPSDFFDVPVFGYGIDNQDKGPGKAMSYAVKYALLKALGLETGDDPDQDNIDHDEFDAPKERDRLKAAIGRQTDPDKLDHLWNQKSFASVVEALPDPMRNELTKAFTDRMAEITPPKAVELDGDEIPY